MITGVFVRGSKCEPTCIVTITVLCHGEFVNDLYMLGAVYFKEERVYDPRKI
jgi:hypothetical protein